MFFRDRLKVVCRFLAIFATITSLPTIGYLQFRAGDTADHVFSTLSDHAQDSTPQNFVWLDSRYELLSGATSLKDHFLRYAAVKLMLVILLQHSEKLSATKQVAYQNYVHHMSRETDLDEDEKQLCALVSGILENPRGIEAGIESISSTNVGRQALYRYSLILKFRER